MIPAWHGHRNGVGQARMTWRISSKPLVTGMSDKMVGGRTAAGSRAVGSMTHGGNMSRQMMRGSTAERGSTIVGRTHTQVVGPMMNGAMIVVGEEMTVRPGARRRSGIVMIVGMNVSNIHGMIRPQLRLKVQEQ